MVEDLFSKNRKNKNSDDGSDSSEMLDTEELKEK